MSKSKRQRGITDILLLGVLAVVALVAAGYFLFGQSFMAPATNLFMAPVSNLSRQIGLPIATPASSNDVASLESEINATEFDSIDSDLSNLEKELDSALTE